MEDNELISFVAMNPDELDLTQAASNFHRIADEDNYITGSDDFVVVNRYGGREWECQWLEDNGVFFWHTSSSDAAKQEAKERGECWMNRIEEVYGSFQKFAKTIY